MAKKKKEELSIELPQIKKSVIRLRVVGDSPLVMHNWSEKAKQMIRDTQMQKPKQKRGAKDPEEEFNSARYMLVVNGKAVDAIPTIAFKKAAVDACSHIEGVTKVLARGAFHVEPGKALLPIRSQSGPKMREDMVRVGMGSADLRYRPMYEDWFVDMDIFYNKNVISPGQIANLFNTAGFAIGVGEGRPQKNGEWGMFHVETPEDE